MCHVTQPVLSSLSRMMDGCALPVAIRKEVSCGSVSATCVSSCCMFASCIKVARCFASQDSTAQHSTAQHSTAQHSTAQHSTAQHSTAQQLLDMAACSCGLLQYHRVAGFEHLCDTAQVVHADLFVSDRFTGWRERVLTNLSELYSQQTRGFPADVSQQMVARVTSSLPMPCKLP